MSRIQTGKGTGNYVPSEKALKCLAKLQKNYQGSVRKLAKICDCDKETMRKVLENFATKAGYLAAYGSDPKDKMVKVPVEWEYKKDPERMTQLEMLLAYGNCMRVANMRNRKVSHP